MLHSLDLARSFQVDNAQSCIASEANDKTIEGAATFTRDKVAYQNSLAALPLVTYQIGETVIAYGSRTARLLILKKGAVAIIKEDTEIAKVTDPGAVFGEFSVLLDQPNKVDVRTLETSQFHVADATVLVKQNPIAAHVTMVLARQLDNANDLQMYRTLPWIS